MPHKRQRVSVARRHRPRVNRRGRHWARRLHRWLGICALLFAIVLSISGIILNHADDMGLDRRYVQAGWLLDWYGIEAPPPAASYQAGAHRVTQLGERLYFDDRELPADAGALAGAVQVGEFFAVAAGSRLLLATAEGELIESIELADGDRGGIAGVGRHGDAVVLRRGDRWYRSDDQFVSLQPVESLAEAEIDWSAPSAVSRPQLATLQQLYRGRGVSGERLVADFHSGRLFGRFGPLVMDAAGLALLVLGITGLILFLRRRKKILL